MSSSDQTFVEYVHSQMFPSLDVNLMNDLIELTFKRQFAEIFGNEHIFESEH